LHERIWLSVIVPTLDEAEGIAASLAPLQAARAAGCEVIVVDGGSRDGTAAVAQPLADRVLTARRGRATQMNAGAELARGDALLFLHADTVLPSAAPNLVRSALLDDGYRWGRFDVRLSAHHPLLRLVGWMMNWRSHLSGIATGDQAVFVRRDAFAAVGGFPPIPLMEDIALARRLKRLGRPARVRDPVITSSRRWEERGILRTVLLMWGLRLAYAAGVAPERLLRRYYP
jgi:rSAM/selenodomain-associated transferase 2